MMSSKVAPGEQTRQKQDSSSSGAGPKRYGLLACLILAGWAVAVLSLWPLHNTILNLDEVDYFNASRLGLLTNAVDRGSLSPIEFFEFINSKRKGVEPVYPPQYDEQKDPLLLRHYHPPFIVYVTAATTPLLNSQSDRAIRIGQFLGVLALFCALFFAYRSLSVAPTLPGMLAVMVFGIGLSYLAFYSLSNHGWLSVWTTLTAAFLSRWLKDGDKRAGLLLCASVALTVVSLETGLVVAASVFLTLLIWKPLAVSGIRSLRFWRYILTGTLLTALLVILFWPGSVLKASFFKTPIVIFYRSFLGQEFKRTIAPFLTLLPISLPVFAACIWLFYRQRDGLRRWGPYLTVGAVYAVVIIVVTPFGLVPQYLVPALAPLACLVGMALDSFVSVRPGRATAAALVALLVVSVAATAWASKLHTMLDDKEIRQDISWLKEVIGNREALTNGSQIYQHYLGPGYKIRPIELSYDEDQIFVREKGKYRLVTQEEVAGRFVVIPSYRTKLFSREGEGIRALLGKCRRLDRATLRVYDCSAMAPADVAGLD
ncbi:MAG TPA: hypothetical protein VF543_00640 [Pyrinomonadaceae bacterium]|jgi:hypothetical protein